MLTLQVVVCMYLACKKHGLPLPLFWMGGIIFAAAVAVPISLYYESRWPAIAVGCASYGCWYWLGRTWKRESK